MNPLDQFYERQLEMLVERWDVAERDFYESYGNALEVREAEIDGELAVAFAGESGVVKTESIVHTNDWQ